MFEQQRQVQDRTKQFAVRVFRMTNALPHGPGSSIIAKQVLRSASSVAANYRAVARARSKSEFVAKMGVVVEEIDETVFWLELISDTGLMNRIRLQPLVDEAKELLSMFAAAYRTSRKSRR